MRDKRKILLTILFLIALVGMFTAGHLWKDIPGIKFNNEVKIYEVFSLLLTLAIGVSIPLLVKKWIEDNRSVKSSLVDEVKSIISSLDKVNQIISDCHSCGAIDKTKKDEINYLFHSAELQITSFDEQLKISFPSCSAPIMTELKTIYHVYKDYLTGGELMISSFDKVDDRFYREHGTENSKIETHLKKLIHKIHKF